MHLVLNGRFLRRPMTGVERVAFELTRAMRDLLARDGSADLEVLVPPGPDLARATLARLGEPPPAMTALGTRSGHLWEQVDLSAARAQSWLVSLCNTGPVARRRQAVVIHDALFVEHPGSFSRRFRWWYRALLTLLARRAAVVFTVSDHSRASLERHRLVPRGRARVLRLGADHLEAVVADPAALVRAGVERGGYILAIGSRARHKNVSLLVDAFADAGLAGVRLVIAGGGNARVFQDDGLRETAGVRHIGRVSDGELKALYAGALAFACPSLSEGFGLPALEAMAMGCPVVATTGGAVPEVCADAAIYADPGDRAAWRDALRRIAGDRALRDALSARARARARGFTWRGAAAQMLEALVEADAGQRPTTPHLSRPETRPSARETALGFTRLRPQS